MNFNEDFKLENTFALGSGQYLSNASPLQQQPNLIDLGFGSADVNIMIIQPFSKTRTRLNSSPLKTPLESAINKVVTNLGKDSSSSRVSAGYSSQISVRNQQGQYS